MSVLKNDNKTKRCVLAIAGALLLLALALHLSISGDDPVSDIVSTLRSYGYRVYDSDLYIAGDYRNTSIAALLPEKELEEARKASLKAGFPSDTERIGDVVLILSATREGEILTLYALDGELELCFIQYEDSKRVGVLGE